MNLISSFVEIINDNECLRGFDLYKKASWPSIEIKRKASECEWSFFGFKPITGNVGEVVGIIENDLYKDPLYVIQILGMFYVPITTQGFRIISEKEYIIKKYSQIEIILNSPEYFTLEKDNQYKVVWQDEYCAFMDKNGNLITDYKYNMAASFKEGRALIQRDGCWGFIDYEGNEIIPPKFKTANSFSEGRAIVETYNWHAINRYGDTASKSYDEMSDFSGGLAVVIINCKYGFIDIAGSEKIPLIYDSVFRFHNGFAIAKKNMKYGAISVNGCVKVPFIYDHIGGVSMNGYFPVMQNDKWGLINILGDIIVNFKYDSIFIHSDELFVCKKNEKYGYINDKEEIKIPFTYNDAGVFVNGIAKVVMGEKTGYIDPNNNIIIPFIYDEGEKETGGLFPVRKGLKWGCINRLNEVVIPFKLDDSCSFENNVAEVFVDDDLWLVNNEGVFIKKLESTIFN